MKRQQRKFSLATLIVTYEPREALRSLSKENGASSGKSLDRNTLPDFLRSSGFETGSTSLVRIIEELLEWKSSGSGIENRY
jgi:hypothetical protein